MIGYENLWQIASVKKTEESRHWGCHMSFLERCSQAHAQLAEHGSDSWRKKLEAALRGVESIGTAALLDLVHAPATTGTARRLAKNMRSLGFVQLKSRRFLPGGNRDTVVRGWTRPFREAPTMKPTGVAGADQERIIP